MKIIIILITLLILIQLVNINAQPSWEAEEEQPAKSIHLFNSPEVFSLPTTETQSKGDFYFGIYHKFVIPVSNGIDDLFGIDGGVVMRISLGYTPLDNLFLNFGRSNKDGNYDFQAKYKLLSINNETAPMNFAINGGLAYNSKLNPEPVDKSRLYQYYFSLIANTLISEKIGIGVAPSYLINSNCNCEKTYNSFTLGTYIQYFFNEHWSLFVEANPTITGWRNKFDSYTTGVEYELGGHFFKIILTNNTSINSSQYLSGAGSAFETGDLHIGFVISRVM